MRDSYTTEIRKFTVRTDMTDVDLFFSPEEVHNAKTDTVELNVALDEGESLEVKYGADVVDKDGKILGTVDYPIRDRFTGEIRSFKVNQPGSDEDIFFSTDDILEINPSRIKLRISLR